MIKIISSITLVTFISLNLHADFKTAEEICSMRQKYKTEIESLPEQIKAQISCLGRASLNACAAVVGAVAGGVLTTAKLNQLIKELDSNLESAVKNEYKKLAQVYFDDWKASQPQWGVDDVKTRISEIENTLSSGRALSPERLGSLKAELRFLEAELAKGELFWGETITRPSFQRTGYNYYANAVDIKDFDEILPYDDGLDLNFDPKKNIKTDTLRGKILEKAQTAANLIKELFIKNGTKIPSNSALAAMSTSTTKGITRINNKIYDALVASFDEVAKATLKSPTAKFLIQQGAKQLPKLMAAVVGAGGALGTAISSGAFGAATFMFGSNPGNACESHISGFINLEETMFDGCQPSYEINSSVVNFLDLDKEKQKHVLSDMDACRYYVNLRNKMFSPVEIGEVSCKRDSIKFYGKWSEKGESGIFTITKDAQGVPNLIEFQTSKNNGKVDLTHTSRVALLPDGTINERSRGNDLELFKAASLAYSEVAQKCATPSIESGASKSSSARGSK